MNEIRRGARGSGRVCGGRWPDSDHWSAHQEAMRDRLTHIAALERQIRGLQAAQVEAIAGFVADRTSYDEAHGWPVDRAQHHTMAAEIAIAKRVSVSSASRMMSGAYLLAQSNPATLAALSRGDLSLNAATTIAHETDLLDDPGLVKVADEVICAEAIDVVPGKVRALAERVVAELDPDAATARNTRERGDRHVTVTPAGSAMVWLSAYLPAEQGLACWHALHEDAISRYSAGEPGPVTQLMCDSLVERVTGAATDALPAHINVMMTDATLLGLSDQPAHLVGAGPIPAPIGRMLATSGSAWLRRFVTDPVDATISSADNRRRRFDGALRDLVTARDQNCRGINCAAPIRDIDHIVEYSHGGLTTLTNGQGLSKACHATRDDPRMQVDHDRATGVVTWTTPHGMIHRSLPPPALAPGSITRQQRDLRWLLLHPSDSALELRTLHQVVRHMRQPHARGPSGEGVVAYAGEHN